MTTDEKKVPKDKTIGSLNGMWAFLLKGSLVAFPVFLTVSIAWASWITSETFKNKSFRDQGDRVTALDMAKQRAEIFDRLSALPPKQWQDRINKMEGTIKSVELNQAKILTILERIEAKK
jgi:hypothetical protein